MNIYMWILPPMIGMIIDSILGDPYGLIHPIRGIGNLISFFDKLLYKKDASNKSLYIRGIILWILVVTIPFAIAVIALYICFRINPWLYVVAQSILCYYMVAAKCLKTESLKVYNELAKKDIIKARYAVSMLVARDTKNLDEEGVSKACVETIAENTSDGVIAPLFYMALGGGVFALFYKSVNTMDSMIGYKNDKYMYFGRFAAKMDDIFNYIPARLAALAMIIATPICGFDKKGAIRIFKRDRYKSKSPNAGQTEAVCAGALGIKILGDAWYFGKLVKKDSIGDEIRKIDMEDINRANYLMYATTAVFFVFVMIVRTCIGIGLLL